jgi:ABC-type lipoprotein release transport system permease subunit
MPCTVQAAPLFWTLLLGVLAAVLAGTYPAYRAARTNPAPQLRED